MHSSNITAAQVNEKTFVAHALIHWTILWGSSCIPSTVLIRNHLFPGTWHHSIQWWRFTYLSCILHTNISL